MVLVWGGFGTGANAVELEALWRAGCASLPGVSVDFDTFRAFVGDHEVDSDLAGDVVLACACARRIPAALRAFEVGIGPSLDRVIRRVCSDPAQWDDMRQLVRERLLVGRDGAAGKIEQYSGRAPLRHWVRVVAVRVVHSAHRRRKTAPAEDDTLFEELVDVQTPEDALDAEQLIRACKQAFQAAFSGLDAPARAILRLSVVERAGIDVLARLLGVHRATAARRLAAARAQLTRGLAEHVGRATNLTASEAARALRTLESRLDPSVSRVMREAGDG